MIHLEDGIFEAEKVGLKLGFEDDGGYTARAS